MAERRLPNSRLVVLVPVVVIAKLDRLKDRSSNRDVKWRAGHALGFMYKKLMDAEYPAQSSHQIRRNGAGQSSWNWSLTPQVTFDFLSTMTRTADRYLRMRRSEDGCLQRTPLRFSCVVRGEVPVMARPEDEIAAGAGGRGHLRASFADREQVIEILKVAFVQGRFDRDEFGVRVDQAFASRTYAELAAITADLPGELARPLPPAPARAQGRQPIWRPGRVAAAATVLYAGVWVYAIVFPRGVDSDTDGVLVFLAGFVYLVILAICVGQAAALREMRSGGQSPRRPAAGAGGPAAQRVPSTDPGRQLPPAGHGHQHTAEAVRRRLLRPGNPHTMSARLIAPVGL